MLYKTFRTMNATLVSPVRPLLGVDFMFLTQKKDSKAYVYDKVFCIAFTKLFKQANLHKIFQAI